MWFNNLMTQQPDPNNHLLIYEALAEWWPLLSSPSDYQGEAAWYRDALLEAASRPLHTLLELGSGGGNNASHLRACFELTLVDRSAAMLHVSEKLNPTCEHIQADMRTLRLGRQFDGVFIHDAIMYLTTPADLAAAVQTAAIHCRPGGAALFVPDVVCETFRPLTKCGGHDGEDGRGLRYLSWTWDPDPTDTSYVVDYALLLREPGGQVRVLNDRHTLGLFPTQLWLDTLSGAGFQPRAFRFEPEDSHTTTVFSAHLPGGLAT